MIAGISGAVAALTSVTGFCPLCALFGRKPVVRQFGEGAWAMTASVERAQLR
ncbi:YgaP-like transmembrane domain [Undibacterium sp. Ji50W]|uniref:YgaP-like transmembrane domain n=1 Tax=Undibacterium sp. Ji50W TaxID=3413041 RepID=UPI003BF141B7